MRLTFQSLCSSSAGNCLLLSSDRTTILIDCGFGSQRACRAVLDGYGSKISAVLVTHAHGDHMSYSALKVLQGYGATVHCHEDVHDEIEARHVRRLNSPFRLAPFADCDVTIGDFCIKAVRVPHAPGCPTFGFVIRYENSKLVFCTDFHTPDAIAEHMIDADFIFVESNHDLELLRKYPNYASHFHLSNPKSAALLRDTVKASRRPPQHVMLGHLSEERNSDKLALKTVRDAFKTGGVDLDFGLTCAPRRGPSEMIGVG